MRRDAVILVAENDEGHFSLIKKNLQRSGLWNEMIRFTEGQQVLDFLLKRGQGPEREPRKEYLLVLDIRMPEVDGVQVLREIKQDRELRKIPVIVLTDTDDPHQVRLCHSLGCGVYIVKPDEYEAFTEVIRKVGLFLSVVEVPRINATA